MTISSIHVVGGGLAGSEAAWQIARAGIPVVIHEMRPVRTTEAHVTGNLAELVCSNSFRSDEADTNAVGLLHEELRRSGSLIMMAADRHRVPAGAALAVDRNLFSATIQETLTADPLVTVARNEVAGLPPSDWDSVIVATGPLTSPALAEAVRGVTGENSLAFFHAESVDTNLAWFESRWGKGDGTDYLNCPMTQPQYNAFVEALRTAETTEFKEWERDTPYFEGCLPVEVMATRGPETLRYGPMKPIGLTDPKTGRRPWAVVQLRRENALGTLYNLVGFQTKMKYAEQVRVLRMIPGLENANFARLGGIHRNTFLNSPKLLDPLLRLRAMPRLRFAGQITGVEGYVESTAMGLLAGRFAAAERLGRDPAAPPPTTSMGALLRHITGGATAATFQPMNANFGLFPPPIALAKGEDRKRSLSTRARADFTEWLRARPSVAAE